MDLARWLELRGAEIAHRWIHAIRGESGAWKGELSDLGDQLSQTLVSLLPGTMTAYRKQMMPLWLTASELYGSVAARRGLSAGEVIDEFQEVRNAILRLMFEDPPFVGGRRLSMRDLLHLTRVVDRGVTRASVGHTDLLFFSLIDGTGVPATLGPNDVTLLKEQLDTIAKDGQAIMRHLSNAHQV